MGLHYYHHVLSNDTRRFYKHQFNKKARQLGEEALKEIKQEFNNKAKKDYWNSYQILKSINFDDVIKDTQFVKRKSRQVCPLSRYGKYVEQRCSGSRVIFGGYT